MLAMVITAFVASLAYQGLSSATTAATSLERQVKLLGDIQLPLTILERDIRHVVLRAIRDEFNTRREAFSGGNLNDYPLVLTRRGWDNPRGLARGELQRVRYVLEDDELWRESWSVLDRMTEEDGQRRTLLLKGVTEFTLAFLDPQSAGAAQSVLGGEWVDDWNVADRLPAAVDISMQVKNFGRVRRVFGIQGY
ncbi:MAG: type II secretion system minor pseudopilin GspJ [Spongiibacteraceae bacterium]|nr:type II secretion system minor pseudopilin GspJ [Spongiibacteraceae bacterium]